MSQTSPWPTSGPHNWGTHVLVLGKPQSQPATDASTKVPKKISQYPSTSSRKTNMPKTFNSYWKIHSLALSHEHFIQPHPRMIVADNPVIKDGWTIPFQCLFWWDNPLWNPLWMKIFQCHHWLPDRPISGHDCKLGHISWTHEPILGFTAAKAWSWAAPMAHVMFATWIIIDKHWDITIKNWAVDLLFGWHHGLFL